MTTRDTRTRTQRLHDMADSVNITLPPIDHEDYERDITEVALRLADRVEDYRTMSSQQTNEIGLLTDELAFLKAAYARAENTTTNVVDENKRLTRDKSEIQEEVSRLKDYISTLETKLSSLQSYTRGLKKELSSLQAETMDTTCRPAEVAVDESTFPPRSTALTTERAKVTFTRDGATLTITVTALPSVLKNAVAGVFDAVEVIP